MEISGKNAGERNEVMQSRVAVIPSTGVTVPLGDIDVENTVLISDQFNVSEFHAIEALAGSAGENRPGERRRRRRRRNNETVCRREHLSGTRELFGKFERFVEGEANGESVGERL